MKNKERIFVYVLAGAFAVFTTLIYGVIGLKLLDNFNDYLIISITFFPFMIVVANFMANNIVIRFKD